MKEAEVHLHAATGGGTQLSVPWAALWCRTKGCHGEPRYAAAAMAVAKGENILLWRPSGEGQISENQWGTLEFQACPHLLALARKRGWREKSKKNDFFEFCEENRGNFTIKVEMPDDLLKLLSEFEKLEKG